VKKVSKKAEITPIAYIHNDFKEKFGVPRQSGRVETISEIVFEPQFRDENALLGMEQFSHLWLIFDFSLSHRDKWSPTIRPPRLGGNKRVGVFASRSPFRPNNLGLSVVKIEQIKKTADRGTVLIVSGADLIDNTPIYDIKPYIPYADSIPDALGGYAEENKDHKLEVIFPEELKHETNRKQP
jgi:tRNA-Thr(GGU) m(6)t(6)A37 methyltransferase TsaA